MYKYSCYEKLNLYFSNKQYEDIENSIDEIFVLVNLKDYTIKLKQAHPKTDKANRFAIINITHPKNRGLFIIYLNYNISNQLCIFESIEFIYRKPYDDQIDEAPITSNITKSLNKIKLLL